MQPKKEYKQQRALLNKGTLNYFNKNTKRNNIGSNLIVKCKFLVYLLQSNKKLRKRLSIKKLKF